MIIPDDETNYCESCEHGHGPLYICESYPAERKRKLRRDTVEYIRSLNDSGWVQKQIDNGVPPEAIAILRAMAGL